MLKNKERSCPIRKRQAKKVVKPEPPKTDDLPNWEEMIDDLETPTKQEEVDITNKTT